MAKEPKPIDDDFIANVATSSRVITVAIEGSWRAQPAGFPIHTATAGEA